MTRQPTAAQDNADFGESDIFDLGQIFQILRRRWLIVSAMTMLCVAISVVAALNTTRLYSATTQVRIQNLESRIVEFDGVVAGRNSDAGTIESEVATIRSRQLASRLVNAMNLTNDPEFNPALRERRFDLNEWINPRVVVRRIISAFRNGFVTGQAGGNPSYEAVVTNVQNSIRARRSGISYIVDITFTSASPDKAAALSNAVAEQYIIGQLEARYERARAQSGWLSTRLDALRDQLREAETAVATYAAENNLIPSGGATVTEQQLNEISQQLALARAETAAAEARFSRVQQIASAGGDLSALLQVTDSQTLSTLRTQLTSLRREEAEFAGRYGDRHPDLINVRQEITEVQRQMRLEAQRIVASTENDVEVARSRESSLENSLAQISGVQAENNQSRVQLRELERTAANRRAIYETFLSEFSETREQEGLESPGAIVISEATPPQFSTYPNNTRTVVFGFAVGFAIGFGIAFTLERLDRGVRTREQVEAQFGVHQISAVPLLKAADLKEGSHSIPPEDYFVIKPLSVFSESLRALKTGVALSNIDAPPQIILITSSLPNEGKTTLSLSVARMYASSGARTLLIDADLRHPSLHGIIRPDEKDAPVGLFEVLTGDVRINDALQNDFVDNLSLLFAGRRAENPPDLLESERMKEFLRAMRGQYDYVIIDTAPILPVVDGRILSRLVDTTVFLVKWNRTPRDAIRDALRHLRDFEANVAGVVLNQVDLSQQKRYGYGSTYYYYNQYKKYYAD